MHFSLNILPNGNKLPTLSNPCNQPCVCSVSLLVLCAAKNLLFPWYNDKHWWVSCRCWSHARIILTHPFILIMEPSDTPSILTPPFILHPRVSIKNTGICQNLMNNLILLHLLIYTSVYAREQLQGRKQ